jgi:uncharacterized protein (TIRG00374 family)
MRKLPTRHLIWIFAAGLMAGFLYWGRRDLGSILDLDPLMVTICFGATAGIALTTALKWRLALRCLHDSGQISFGSLLYYFMMGRAVGLVMPMDVSDFAVRTVSLKLDHSVSIGKASYSVYLDRSFDLVVAGLFLIPSVLHIVGSIGAGTALVVMAGAFILGLIAFVFFAHPTMRLVSFVFRLLFKAVCKIPWIGRRVHFETESRILEEAKVEPIATSLYFLSGVKFLFTSLRFIAIGAAVGIGAGAKQILAFVPGAQFTAMFALTPGGLGIADWSWSGLLYEMGVGREQSVPYLISLRLVISLSIVVLAMLSRMVHRKPRPEGG